MRFLGSGGVLSGRFHATCFALACAVPVITVPSNTHKIEGMLKDCGLQAPQQTAPFNRESIERLLDNYRASANYIEQCHEYRLKGIEKIEQLFAKIAAC